MQFAFVVLRGHRGETLLAPVEDIDPQRGAGGRGDGSMDGYGEARGIALAMGDRLVGVPWSP
jgi:hypothetical protein